MCSVSIFLNVRLAERMQQLQDLKGEELNIIIGSIPYHDEENEKIKNPAKLLAMKLLNDRYGITEKDFTRAEIEMVPAYKAVDIGLDRGLIGSYGQDDRVCAYTALMAEIAAENPEHTTFTILTDKEEIGSVGNTGLHSDYVHHAVEDLAESFGADTKTVLRHSICLSSDVNAAYDPTFASDTKLFICKISCKETFPICRPHFLIVIRCR